MTYSQILVSVILIFCGFLVKKYPNLIAGYNMMSQEKKEKVNINAFSTFLKQLLIGLGVFTMVSLYISILIDIDKTIILYLNIILILFGIAIGLIYANTSKKFKN